MIALKASEIADIVGGKLVGNDIEVTSAPVFNSKQAKPGSIFLALVGENSDGHQYTADAFLNGSVLAFVTNAVPQRCIVVGDVLAALNTLASFVRQELVNLKVIALTGSQGKTTTKDLLSHILRTVAPTVSPIGNFNNELGAPITLLECDDQIKYCILEMGARHVGDIAALCQMAKPDIGMVLKVGTAHIGEFGSAEKVAQAKSEMISALNPSATAILGSYDEFTPAMQSLHSGITLTFGESSKNQIRASDIEIREGRPHFDLITPAGRVAVGLRLVGIHQVANALAAAAAATVLEIPLDVIASGLSTADLQSKWRMEISEIAGMVLINDSYNASPESTEAALRTLKLFAQERGGQSWAFLGAMHELGQSSALLHAQVGALAAELGIDHIVCIAADGYATDISVPSQSTVHILKDKDSALALIEQMSQGDVLLVKASRAEKFELLADSIAGNLQKKEFEGEI